MKKKTRDAFKSFRVEMEEKEHVRKDKERQRDAILLMGEVAFALDDAISEKVMKSNDSAIDEETYPIHVTVNEVQQMARASELSNVERERWKQFEDLCKVKKMGTYSIFNKYNGSSKGSKS